MLQNYDVDITEFLKLTNAGLFTADFVQVKAALIKRYKATYGSDIDLSTASADGIFVNDLALIINNILKTVSTIYANLDVNQASGVYLDLLCRLSNITRRPASNSNAAIIVTNLGTATITLPARMEFIDKSGQQWTATNDYEITVEAGKSASLTVVCDILGPVEAPAGYINAAIDASFNISVVQENSAVVGTNVETDSDLRERRAQSNGAQGVTVLESLYGALREIGGIQDVKLYNNATNDVSNAPQDSTAIPAHNVYVILRKRENVIVEDSKIGNTIYEKMTPGISTTQFAGTGNGVAKKYDYIPSVIGVTTELFNQSVYWKECIGIKPAFNVKIKPREYFNKGMATDNSEGTFKVIANSLMQYLNALAIGTTPSAFDIENATYDADPLFKGRPTFTFVSASAFTTNPDTYYDYTKFAVTANNDSTYTIALS